MDPSSPEYVISERLEVDTAHNFARSMDAIYRNYQEAHPEETNLEQLREKAKGFENTFDQKVFDTIGHNSDIDLPEESGQVTLKAPGKLEGAFSSGQLDQDIGNTKYVFASSDSLPHKTPGEYRYAIDSRDCTVASVDIAQIHPPEQLSITNGVSQEDYDRRVLEIYAKNLFTYDDFKTFFATYSASMFDNPDEALDFYQHHAIIPDLASAWSNDMLNGYEGRERDVLTEMTNIYKDSDVHPPFSPEFQFKDEVKARKIK